MNELAPELINMQNSHSLSSHQAEHQSWGLSMHLFPLINHETVDTVKTYLHQYGSMRMFEGHTLAAVYRT